MIFIFMNLNAGWIHRIDRPNWTRPFRAPTWLLATGGVLGYVNLFIIGMGADIWGPGTLLSGLVLAAMIVPVFWWRHYVVDKGIFPRSMRDDMYLTVADDPLPGRSAGFLPYMALAGGVIVVAVGHVVARF
jgi:hypothetical protein